MSVKHTGKTPAQVLSAVQTAIKRFPKIAGTEAVRHFKQGFRDEGFTDISLNKWKGREYDPGRAILKKSGALQKAVRILRSDDKRVTVGVDLSEVPYAEIHNTGGTIPVTPQMKKYFWAMYYKTRNPYFRNLALTQRQFITIPQRKFIGKSERLNDAITAKMDFEIKKALG